MSDQSILIRQSAGDVVDWYDESFHGPFSSREERDQWVKDNPLTDTTKERYVIRHLDK